MFHLHFPISCPSLYIPTWYIDMIVCLAEDHNNRGSGSPLPSVFSMATRSPMGLRIFQSSLMSWMTSCGSIKSATNISACFVFWNTKLCIPFYTYQTLSDKIRMCNKWSIQVSETHKIQTDATVYLSLLTPTGTNLKFFETTSPQKNFFF